MEKTVNTHHDAPEHELPEAFTEPVDKDAQKLKIVVNNSASTSSAHTSTDFDRVDEASEESFPGSDPSSLTNSTAL